MTTMIIQAILLPVAWLQHGIIEIILSSTVKSAL